MSHFVLDVTHIGEEFVSQLCNTEPGKKTIKEIIKERFKEDFELTSALPNRNIAVGGKCGDAKSQIDVALIGKSCCYAVELKLGSAICTPGGYCQNYLNKPYSSGKKYFSGKIIPILSRMGMEDMVPKPEICVFPDNDPANQIPVNENWILMVRNDVIVEKLKKSSFKNGFANEKAWKNMKETCVIISLQGFLHQLKENGVTDEKIEEMIKSCITPDGGAYIKNWGISSE